MKHKIPEYTFDPNSEYGMDIEGETVREYVKEYSIKIKNYNLQQLLVEISELEIDFDSNSVLGIRVFNMLHIALDNLLNRNR
tara:strand:- start:53 stop:298 length:246 start_codon:yes stop_codon:yes gene_type:complete